MADQSQPVRCIGRLWLLRHERNLSQRDLAELAGASQKTIVDIETGKNHPHPSTLRKLAKAL